MKTIGIASGKGGVGKTTLATNLALSLAKANYRVMLVDGDFGLANVQLALGIQTPFNIGHLIKGEKSLKEVVTTTREGLMVLPGASGVGSLANLDAEQMQDFIKGLNNPLEPLDFLIFDAAAGISDNVTLLLKECDQTLIVVKDEPSSIADAYGIIKVLKTECAYESVGIISNCVQSEKAAHSLHVRLNSACIKFLGIDYPLIGFVEDDKSILEAAKKYKPVIDAFPSSRAAANFRSLTKRIASLN